MNYRRKNNIVLPALCLLGLLFPCIAYTQSPQKEPVDYVNPFIGSSNYGTTNPGAVCPNGLMSVSPFNVMGSKMNRYDKDSRWWSTPYAHDNKYFTGFSHVNLSGVGCPETGSLLLTATTGTLDVDYHNYGSTYTDETATPGYYSLLLTKYGIKAEVSATMRSSIAQFTFPEGEGHVLLNLGEGLTNESGAYIRKTADNEYSGMKLLGTFCYTESQAVFPIYFVIRTDKGCRSGYWKYQRDGQDWEDAWNREAGKYKIYTKYAKDMAGDDTGIWFSFDCNADEKICVRMGVSFTSIENARKNLLAEQYLSDSNKWLMFSTIRDNARTMWNEALSKIKVEGGNEDRKIVFYTALYHTLIHPNILQDANGDYPAMESSEILNTQGNRYTVFSLWDTYRNVHPLMCLLYPDKQLQMVKSIIDMYKESGWLPKWELFGRESLTMEGDPATIVICDTWQRGLQHFDINTAYEAMYKSATEPGNSNKLRPDNDDYMKLGYVPLRSKFDNSVSHALEYYVADAALSGIAQSIGKQEDAMMFAKRASGYRKYFSSEYGILRPKLPDGTFLSPFDPKQGENFEPSPGFHEGNAWNYTFAVPHDIPGLIQLMGGRKKFTEKLQSVFDNGYFDIANEPDISYPHFFSYVKGEEWRTHKTVTDILNKHFKNEPGGLPGNDDTGTMSAWAVFNMTGFYPDCPGKPDYTLTIPSFDRITIQLNRNYYDSEKIEIKVIRKSDQQQSYRLRRVLIDGKVLKGSRITHMALTSASEIVFEVD